MPEEERDSAFDPDEEYPWDCDLPYGIDEEFEAEDD
jgi:hypothetical protein